jgi:hypothetical protein
MRQRPSNVNVPPFVRCIDNALAADVLTVGSVYEVLQVRDGYYVLSFGQFRMARFEPVSATEAAAGEPQRAA